MNGMAETEEYDRQHGYFFQLRSEKEMNKRELHESLKVNFTNRDTIKFFKAYLILMLPSAKFLLLIALLRIRHWPASDF